MNTLFIFSARYLFLIVPLIALLFFWKQSRSKQKEIMVFALISLPLIYLLAVIANHTYFDPRPFIIGNFKPLIPASTDNGFPSDHTLLVSAIAAIIMYFNRRVGLTIWAITICVGVSRVYVGVHHLVDIIGSIIISLIITFVVSHFIKHIRTSYEITRLKS